MELAAITRSIAVCVKSHPPFLCFGPAFSVDPFPRSYKGAKAFHYCRVIDIAGLGQPRNNTAILSSITSVTSAATSSLSSAWLKICVIANLRRSGLNILPTAVLGNSVNTSRCFGMATYSPIRSVTNSSYWASEAVPPTMRSTNTHGTSPECASGWPIAPTKATSGWTASASSIVAESKLWPPRMIGSFAPPVIILWRG